MIQRKWLAILILLLLGPTSPHAEVLVDIDLDEGVVDNSGALGDGVLMCRKAGAFVGKEDRNDRSGQAFDTGANAMGAAATNTEEVGTIEWPNSRLHALRNPIESFTLYMWIKPGSELGHVARVFSNGSIEVGFEKDQVFVQINQKSSYLYFHGLSKASVGKWTFLAVAYSAGELRVGVGHVDSGGLAVKNALSDQLAVNPSGSDFVIGNNDNVTLQRPFRGSIGAFYMDTEADVDVETVFETTRAQYATTGR